MEILKNTICELYPEVSRDININNAVMDSRKVGKDSLFFAINSGNDHVLDAIAAGASLVICDRADDAYRTNTRVLVVEDTVAAMGKIARAYRSNLNVKIVAITGSNGKTTTKDMLYSILRQKYKVIKTEKNYNNHIGLPYTIMQIQEDHHVAILEMGMSAKGEIDYLAHIAMPDIGIITNIGESHLEFLKTRQNVFEAKTELLNYIKHYKAFVGGDDEYLATTDCIKIGYNDNNDIQIRNYHEDLDKIEFRLNEFDFVLHMNGRHNCADAALALAVSKELGLTYDELKRGLDNIELTGMRFEKIERGDNLYINDAYNASPRSMKCSLETLADIYKEKYKIAILGDMLELGDDEIDYHVNVIRAALDLHIDKIYLYGDRMKKALEIARQSLQCDDIVKHFADKQDIKRVLADEHDSVILLKGSRGMKLEEIL